MKHINFKALPGGRLEKTGETEFDMEAFFKEFDENHRHLCRATKERIMQGGEVMLKNACCMRSDIFYVVDGAGMSEGQVSRYHPPKFSCEEIVLLKVMAS
jgi:hypothetical protein